MSSNQQGSHELAERYAAALFELADETKALDQVAGDLETLKAMIAGSADLRRLIESPLFSRDEQEKAMAAVMEKAGLSDLSRRFTGVVCRNRRLFVLPRMIDAYAGMLAERRGEVRAEVTAAAALDDTQTSALAAALQKVVGGSVKLDVRVDSALLGGLVVRVGSRMFDSSLRTKLQRMRLAMKGIG